MTTNDRDLYEVVATTAVRVRRQPSVNGAIIAAERRLPGAQVDLVPDVSVAAEGWLWRRLAGDDERWIAERALSSSGLRLLRRVAEQGEDRWDAPVGTDEERAGPNLWPPYWVDATGFLARYLTGGRWAIHTGADLNKNRPKFDADKLAPCYAPALGHVVHARWFDVWGNLVVIEHTLPDGLTRVWTRFGHLDDLLVTPGQEVPRGTLLGHIGNARGRFAYHLHYDVARVDLRATPTHWPGDNLPAVRAAYYDPLRFTRDHHGA